MLGRGAARAEDAQGTPTQRHTSPSTLLEGRVRGPGGARCRRVVRVGGDDGELRPWHYIYEGMNESNGNPKGRRGIWGTPTLALHIRIQPESALHVRIQPE